MAIVDLARTEIADDAEIQPGDRRFWSVTTIIDAVSKGDGLMVWASRLAASAAVDNLGQLTAARYVIGRDAAVRWVGDARNRSKLGELADKDLGTVGHALCEEWTLSGARPGRDIVEQRIAGMGGPKFPADAVAREVVLMQRMLDRYDGWLNRFQPVWKAAEFVVYSPTYGYAGTADGVLALPIGPDRDAMDVINDFKFTRNAATGAGKSKRPYNETVLQLAGYRFADFAAGTVARRYSYYRRRYYLLSEAEQALATPVPEVEGAICTLITPEWCEAFPMRANREAFTAFLYALEIARWSYQTSRGAVGDRLIATTKGE